MAAPWLLKTTSVRDVVLEHPIGHRAQVSAVLLESLSERRRHRSPSSVALRHRN
jgi:hypothetical protein